MKRRTLLLGAASIPPAVIVARVLSDGQPLRTPADEPDHVYGTIFVNRSMMDRAPRAAVERAVDSELAALRRDLLGELYPVTRRVTA